MAAPLKDEATIVILREAINIGGQVVSAIDARKHKATIEMMASGVRVTLPTKRGFVPFDNIKWVEFA